VQTLQGQEAFLVGITDFCESGGHLVLASGGSTRKQIEIRSGGSQSKLGK